MPLTVALEFQMDEHLTASEMSILAGDHQKWLGFIA